MNTVARNITCFTALAGVWIFFFVPNPLLNMLNVQGLEYRLGVLGLFVAIPLVLAIVAMFLLGGPLSIRIAVTLFVPVLGAVICPLLWFLKVYSSTEDLLGAWLYCLAPVISYIIGVLLAIFPLRRRRPING